MTRRSVTRRNLGALLALSGLALATWGADAHAGDFKAVPRTLAKQPTYAGKPGYALVVFGAQMQRRLWLVLDGTTLYVDKNGNGDVSEAGEKVAPVAEPSVEESEQVKTTNTEFEVGDLPAAAGSPAYQGLFVTRYLVQPKPGAPADMKASDTFRIDITVREGCDQSAFPALSARPEDAPIVHLDGPLLATVAAGCEGPVPVLNKGEEGQELTVQIGTQGLGVGTWSPMGYGLVPETVKPVLEITFPPAQAGGAPVVAKFTLDDRC